MHVLWITVSYERSWRKNVKPTDEYNVVIELAFILAFPIQLSHLLQRLKHRLHNFIIGHVDILTYLQGVGTNKLVLNTTDVDREVFDEVGNTVALLAGQLSLLDGFDLARLWESPRMSRSWLDKKEE